jgi:hypothetical protein
MVKDQEEDAEWVKEDKDSAWVLLKNVNVRIADLPAPIIRDSHVPTRHVRNVEQE